MLKKIRISLATVSFLSITLLFLDFTGTAHLYLSWLAEIQLMPALLAHSLAIIVGLFVITLLFGRIYCSIICPLGILQDGISHRFRKKKKNRFKFAKPKSILRYSVLVIFIIAIFADLFIASILDPYAAYGRIAANIFAPIYREINNLFAVIAENANSYAFYETEVWMKSGISLTVAIITLLTVAILARLFGRTYCNTICPVGTFLGFISRFSFFKIKFVDEKCKNCKLCEKNCKASCIDSSNRSVDYSRCVSCFNCIESCKSDAIKFSANKKKSTKNVETATNIIEENANNANNLNKSDNSNLKMTNSNSKTMNFSSKLTNSNSKTINSNSKMQNPEILLNRRQAISTVALTVGGFAAGNLLSKAQLQLTNVDGGLADIEDKQKPARKVAIVPPGATAAEHLEKHCTACQLCVSACPNNILIPSKKLKNLMQPEISYEKGYCRPECVECSLVCPNDAIKSITVAEKTAISIGYAVYDKKKCVVTTDKVQCDNCVRHCPTGAISLVEHKHGNCSHENCSNEAHQKQITLGESDSANSGESAHLKYPVINKELCIGCGACEHLCPARPYSAIYVEGNVRHREV